MHPFLWERRREERLKVAIPARCHPLEDGRTFSTVTLDISSLGARILSDCFLPVKAGVRLDLHLSDDTPLTLCSKTVWCKKEPRFNRYEVGLEFIGDRPNCRALKALLDRWRRDPFSADFPPLEVEPSVVELS